MDNTYILSNELKEKSGFFYAYLTLLKFVNVHAMKFKQYGFNEASTVIQAYILKKFEVEKEWTINLLVAANLNPNINLNLEGIIPNQLKDANRTAINRIMQGIPALDPNCESVDQFGMKVANNEQNQFEKYHSLPYTGFVDVIEFWKVHAVDLPELSVIAKKYIGLYPSSTSIERTFSMAKNVLEDKYGAISAKKAEKRIFAYVNADFAPND